MQDGPGAAAPTAEPPAGTLADRVRRAATLRADRPALVYKDKTLTWAALDRAVDGVARALRRLALPPSGGHPARVAIALANSPDFAVAFFAAQRAGLVAVPVNPAFTGPELRHVLADSAAAVLICTERVRDLVAAMAAELPALTAVHTTPPTAPAEPPVPSVESPGGPSVESRPGPSVESPPGPSVESPGGSDLAVLLYTSGTEGQPKGAMLSHRALLANHEQVGRIDPPVVGADDTVLLALPLFHAYGLNSGLGAVAYHGACGVLVDRFEAAAALEAIRRHQVSVVVGVPSMFISWSMLAESGSAGGPDVGRAMAPVRVAICGAAPLAVGSARRYAEAAGHQVQVGYGLTETAPVLTSTLAGPAAKPDSIGRPIPGVELRLVGAGDEDLWRDGAMADDDEPADDGPDLELSSPGSDPGEIVVRGANLFSGYWPDRLEGPDAEGWWRTGDIAYADADGDLFLVDRLGELILVNGFNVYPQEIERVLNAHVGVAASAVLGVPHPVAGQAVAAYVVLAPGAAVSSAELAEHCARNLARFKCPATIEFVAALPYSAIGKVRKSVLRQTGGRGAE